MAKPQKQPKPKPKPKQRRGRVQKPISPLDKYVVEEEEESPSRLTEDDLKWLL